MHLVALAPDPSARNRFELQLHLKNMSGQAHAAHRGPEQLGVLAGRATTGFAVGADQLDLRYVPTEGSLPVVIKIS